MNKDIFFATDKEIFDALASKKMIYTSNYLVDLCKKRNTLMSGKNNRESLIKYFSELPHSQKDLRDIQETMKANSKTEKNTSIKLENNEIKSDNVFEAIDELIDAREGKSNESYNITSSDPNHIVIDVSYQEIDYSNTRLRQKQNKSARIEIEKDKDGYTSIRMPANEKARELAEEVIKNISNKTETEIKKKTVDLTIVQDEKLRTKYFIELINRIKSITLKEVNSIRVNAFDKGVTHNTEEDDEAKQEVLARLQTAIFKGENLLNTPEYNDFEKKGFYITGITWLSVINETQDKCKMEASFSDSENCKEFAYNIKGVYLKKKDGSYKTTLQGLEGKKRTGLERNIEEASLKIYDEIISEYNSKIQGAN